MDVHDTIGFDLVGMVVDDLVVCGAEPLFMTDYIATAGSCPSGSPRSSRASPRPASRPAAPWSAARPPSTPACWSPTSTTSPAPTTGVVEADDLLGPGRVRPGDAVIAMESSGLHSNGYSLVRHVLLDAGPAGRSTATCPSSGRTLGEELLEPTRIYAKACLDAGRRAPAPTRWRTSPAAGSRPTSRG